MSHNYSKRRRLYDAQERLCYYCGRPMTMDGDKTNGITIDHRIPKSRGGVIGPGNEVGSCRRCNNFKDSMTETEFRALYPDPILLPEHRGRPTALDMRMNRINQRGIKNTKLEGLKILARAIAADAARNGVRSV